MYVSSHLVAAHSALGGGHLGEEGAADLAQVHERRVHMLRLQRVAEAVPGAQEGVGVPKQNGHDVELSLRVDI